MTISAVRGLRVAELAQAVGVRPDTIRYYESAGLLPAPGRTAAGYRVYDHIAVDRLRFMQAPSGSGCDWPTSATCSPSATPVPALRAGRAAAPAPACRGGRGDRPSDRAAERDGGDGRRIPVCGLPPPVPGTWCPPARGGDSDARAQL